MQNNLPLAGIHHKVVTEELYAETLEEIILKCERWDESSFNLVTWQAYKMMFTKLNQMQHVTYTKISHKLLQTNSRNRRFYGTDGKCACCNTYEETFTHVLTCSPVRPSTHRKAVLQILPETLLDIGKQEELAEAIIHGIKSWGDSHPASPFDNANNITTTSKRNSLQEVLKEQTKLIGWEAFHRGCIRLKWGVALRDLGDTPDASVNLWMSDLIRAMLDYMKNIWVFVNGELHGHDKARQSKKVVLGNTSNTIPISL
jgi:hypothetical protein